MYVIVYLMMVLSGDVASCFNGALPQLMEFLYMSGDAQLLVLHVSTLFRDPNCPAKVKDSFVRLLAKCLVTFGANLSAEYFSGSALSPVSATITAHSLTGQWKKIKNVLKTLSK